MWYEICLRTFLKILNKYVPLKKKYLRANHATISQEKPTQTVTPHQQSSNVNEIIRAVLNIFSLFLRFHKHKSTKRYKQTKIKNALKNISGEKSHLFAYLHFCAFAWASFCLLSL